jgi:hypothetical protein
MKADEIDKDFSCLKMKSDIQAEIYAEIKDMSASERIAYYKEGTKESFLLPIEHNRQIL